MSNARDAAADVVRALAARGHVAYFAGGCVRDELLGAEPEDYDVATSAVPDEVRGVFTGVSEVGASFGVMLLHRDGHTIEIATFRTEGAYSDNRRPDAVVYADADADAHRRDFTINALFLDPLADKTTPPVGSAGASVRGELIDLVGGVDDLSRGVVRAVGDPDRRLAEDHLRALRAVRFAARFGFTIDQPTAQAVTRHARELAGVSRERLGDEIRRMLRVPSRAHAVSLLDSLGLSDPVLGADPAGTDPGPWLDPLPADAGLSVALAAWAVARLGAAPGGTLSGLTDEAVDELVGRWRRRLCLSNDERDGLRGHLAAVRTLAVDFFDARVAEQKRTASSPWFDGALQILGVLDPSRAERAAARARELAATLGGLAPEPFLDGAALLGMGLPPGPRLGQILSAVYDAQLEGTVGTVEEARRAAEALITPRTGPNIT